VSETVENFRKSVSKYRFSKLKDFALKMHLMFGNTYACESRFSTMKQVNAKNKNRMPEETLDNSLHLLRLTMVLVNEW